MFNKFTIFMQMIKFEHTIFALPFAYLGAILGSFSLGQQFPNGHDILWISMAMIAARTAAMSLNRMIDKAIDKRNPRTADRALPAGQLSTSLVATLTAISLLFFIVATYSLSELAWKLLPIALGMMVVYSYTKRFTWACHFILGMTIGLAPLGSWIAITGSISWHAVLLFLIVSCWTAGFDILYACQDAEFDRKAGLFSLPSRFGISFSMNIARLFHVFTVIGLVVLHISAGLGYWNLIGIFIAAGLLFREHRLIHADDLSLLHQAFFKMNGLFSGVVFLFMVFDFLWVSWYE
jgi:4-hydroxybenzoate polyprenyltransferase